MHTDASHGYQSPFLAFQTCDAARSLVTRLEGRGAEGPGAKKAELVQREKEGYCPCYTRPTNIGVPPSFALG